MDVKHKPMLKGKWGIASVLTIAMLIHVLSYLLLFASITLHTGTLDIGFHAHFPSVVTVLSALAPMIPEVLLLAYVLTLHKSAGRGYVLRGIFDCCALGALCTIFLCVLEWYRVSFSFDLQVIVKVAWNGMIYVLFALGAVFLSTVKAAKIGATLCVSLLLLMQIVSLLATPFLMTSTILETHMLHTGAFVQPISSFAWLLFCAALLPVPILQSAKIDPVSFDAQNATP